MTLDELYEQVKALRALGHGEERVAVHVGDDYAEVSAIVPTELPWYQWPAAQGSGQTRVLEIESAEPTR